MKDTYGDQLKFVAFDVKIGETWLSVPNAEDVVVRKLGLEFVHFDKIEGTPAEADRCRDQPSTQAKRNGIVGDKPSEGVVLRPLWELVKSNGQRVISKHKRAEFRETKTPRDVDAEKLKILEHADSIAMEWVTDMRLVHVIDKLRAGNEGTDPGIENTGEVIKAMIADVKKEAGVGDQEGLVVAGQEIVWSKDAEKKIGTRAAMLFKKWVKDNALRSLTQESERLGGYGEIPSGGAL